MGDLLLKFLFVFLALFCVPGVIFIAYCIRFYRMQPRILYQYYASLEVKARHYSITYEEIYYQTVDGETISAWYIPTETKEGQPSERVVLFCHGNAGNIAQRIDSFKVFQGLGLNIFIFDYRGYGRSSGRPSEKGTYRDADGAWSYVVDVLKFKPENIILFGRSLGGAVSAYLAEKHPFRAWIIESSFTSIPDMAKQLFPWQPIKWLTRYQYNTLKRIKNVHCPVLVIHSPDDTLIPYSHGRRLYEAANLPKAFLRIRGNHIYGFIESGSQYVDGLELFLDGLELPRNAPEKTEVQTL